MPSPSQIEYFRREGWVAVEGLWDADEVAAMRAELDRLKAHGKIANVATAGDGVTPATEALNLQLVPLAPHSRLFSRMAFAPQAVAAVTELIGAPALLHLDQVFLKPARNGAGTNWHQDNAYFQVADPFKGTAMWTAVHDATRANGTLKVIPRAFDHALEHRRDPESNHHIRCWPEREADAIDVEIPAGGAIFFCYGTPHATGGNRTDGERAGVALHYLRADQAFATGGYPEQHRRPVTEADGRPSRPNGGEAWRSEVAAALA